jgi:hypothetical protein
MESLEMGGVAEVEDVLHVLMKGLTRFYLQISDPSEQEYKRLASRVQETALLCTYHSYEL